MKDISGVIGQLKFWLFEITAIALLLLLAATAVKATGLINVPFLRALGHIEIAYLCGALWLLRR